MIGEVKNREKKKFSKKEVLSFMEKYAILKKQENLERVVPFIFSQSRLYAGSGRLLPEKRHCL